MPSQSESDSDKQIVSDLQRILQSCITGLHTTIATLKKTVLSPEQHQAIDKLAYDTDHLHSILPLLHTALNGKEVVDEVRANSMRNDNTGSNTPMQAEDELAITQEIFGDGFAELARLFLEDSAPRLIALQDAAMTGNCAALAQGAHTLCGSTSSIGATSLAAMCRELELRARKKIGEQADMRLQAIKTEYARIEKKLQTML